MMPFWLGGAFPASGTSGPPPLTPPPVAGYSLWLDSRNSDNLTSEWFDLSGNGNDAFTASGFPSLVPGAVNGLPAYSFSGGDSFATASFGASSDVTIFVVCWPTSDVDKGGVACSVGAQVGYSIGYGGAQGFGASFDTLTDNANTIGGGQDLVSSQALVLGGRFDSTFLGGLSQTLTYNNTIVSWGIGGTPDVESRVRTVGIGADGFGFAGYIMLVLEYPFVLSDAEMESVSAWATGIWAIPASPWTPFDVSPSVDQYGMVYDLGTDTFFVGVGTGGGYLAQYDATSGNPVGTSAAFDYFAGSGLASDGTNVWTSNVTSGALVSVNITTLSVTTYGVLDVAPYYYDGTYLWCAGPSLQVSAVSPSTQSIVLTSTGVGVDIFNIVGDGTYVYVASNADFVHGANDVYQLDPSTANLIRTISFPTGSGNALLAVCTGGGYLWVATATSLLYQVDPSTGSTVNTYDFTYAFGGSYSGGSFFGITSLFFDGTNLRVGGDIGIYATMTTGGQILEFTAVNVNGYQIENAPGAQFQADSYIWTMSTPGPVFRTVSS